ncbi:DNA-processing protein DprA [Patescibacteria group bacterium]|nr:DNA-processing protein DprA [Patescibacteria group bacterium]
MEIKTIEISDELYPKLLRKISDPPKALYFRGELLKDETCFAIVGTRRCSDYGKEIAFSIARDLAEAGLTIVSGMARGIDSMAHKGAIEVQKRTIAVLGTGVDKKSIYPQENLILVKKILENEGCLISEYPPGTPGMKGYFPERNRIISGISLGVLVVEAKFGSGALITANWARKQGRKVFALPGSVHSSNSKGPHFLIKKGARLVENANDILKELNLAKVERKKIKGGSLEENLILEVLANGNLHIDKIIEKTELSSQVVSASLSLMEIEGKVKNLGSNVYALAR